MAKIHLNKGHNLKIKGTPKAVLLGLPCPTKIKIVPDHFQGVKPKLLVKIGDSVKVGNPLFFDKNNPKILFCSNVSGKILNIKFGDRRKVEFIEISCEDTDGEFTTPYIENVVNLIELVAQLVVGCLVEVPALPHAHQLATGGV